MVSLNSRTISQYIKENHGELDQVSVEWSKNKTFYQQNLIQINSKGNLKALDYTNNGVGSTLITGLQSCFVQIIENGTFSIRSFNGKEEVYIRPFDKPTFIQIFAALLTWQGLKPRGISYKEVSRPFVLDKNSDSGSLLVASCKIYGFIPKGKNLVPTKGPDVTLYTDQQSGWFTAMVVLKSNGFLELIDESDGQQLYTIDIKLLTRAEIRELHNSIFESSNYLYVGVIEELRKEALHNTSLTTIQLSSDYPKVKRIILEFPYRIDVEDWLVALTSFTIRQYAGLDRSNSLRVSRKVKLDILEATIDAGASQNTLQLYAEVQIWGSPWYRTAIVESQSNPFFRESFELDLPLTTKSFDIILKVASANHYQTSDEVLGKTQIRYEEFESADIEGRLPIVSHISHSQVGQIYTTVKNQRNYILPPENFNNLEQMILNLDFKQLLRYVLSKTTQTELEQTSVVLLDIFQSLQKEREWFTALIDEEVKNNASKSHDSNLNNIYNTLFRGNSLLTKSLEIYNLRIGQEYLEKVIGKFITGVIAKNETTEIDPMRLREQDPKAKEEVVEQNFPILLAYVEEVWQRIYTSSNDLPEQIKQQLTILRKKIELYTIDEEIALNAIVGFIFLRFFAPVILNPKLFFLTKEHQTGNIKRTLTLISKVLTTFSNRATFGAKEPYMMKFNDAFIQRHKGELSDYLDKITMKKMDFTPKRLKLSSSLDRTDIVLTSKELLKELPTVPFLMDKFLRIDQLVDIVTNENLQSSGIDDFGYNKEEIEPDSDPKTLYKIGSLEFEKLTLEKTKSTGSDFEFGSEKFIQTLLNTKESEGIYSYLNADSSLKDLITEASRLSSKRARLITKLSSSETVKDIYDIKFFADETLSQTIIDQQKNVFRVQGQIPSAKYLKNDPSFNTIKLKFNQSQFQQTGGSNFDSESIASTLRHVSPTKRISQLIRSGSSNTITSVNSSITGEKNGTQKRGFAKWLQRR